VRRIVAASSASVYGLAERFPTREDHHPYDNRTWYGAAKLMLEGLLRSYHAMHGLPYVALRYFNVYGPRMDVHGKYTEVLVRWIERIAAGQAAADPRQRAQTMDFVYIDDVARANVLALQSDAGDDVFNIASGTETSLNELAATLLAVMGSSLTPEYGPERSVNPVPRPPRRHRARAAAPRISRRNQPGRRPVAPGRLVAGPATEADGRMIPIARPWMGEPEAEAARRAILSGWITQGPEVAAFEQEFAAAVGAAHACAVSNCTTALHLALLAAGVGAGDEVVTVSHSYIATANSIRYCGATPVFVDVEPSSFNLDPGRLEQAITPRTRAILCVHQVGLPCDLHAIVEIARRHRVPVIEDAACAIGSEILHDGRWQRIGRPHGDAACFSFHPRKVISTGDGGMITTRHASWDARFRSLRQHAMSVPDTVRHGSTQVVFESYPWVGYNYRMTDIQAAVGREQLKRLPGIVARRRRAGRRATRRAEPHRRPAAAGRARVGTVELAELLCPPAAALRPARRHAGPARCGCPDTPRRDVQPPGRPQYVGLSAPGALPRSEQAQDRCILLPLFPQMTEAELEHVVAALAQACSTTGVGAALPDLA
jgi:dTDP-4-amino-4,6-dideoxygalactose transaminase